MAHRLSNPSPSTLLLAAGGAAALYFLMRGGAPVIPPERVIQMQINLNRFWDERHQLPVTGLYDIATATRMYNFGLWAYEAGKYAIRKNDPLERYFFLGKNIGAMDNSKTKEIIKFKISGSQQTMTMTRAFYEYISTHNISQNGCNDRNCWLSYDDYVAFAMTSEAGGQGAVAH